MSLETLRAAELARRLQVIEDAARMVAAVRERLVPLQDAGRLLVHRTDWSAPSAEVFHERIALWSDRIAAAERSATDALHALRLARSRAHTQAWVALG